jgi:hypothetical protein
VAKQRLVKFSELQSQTAKYNDYDFKVNDMVLLRVEVRRKSRPSWRGLYEVKELRKPNAVVQEVGKRIALGDIVCVRLKALQGQDKIMEEGLSRF